MVEDDSIVEKVVEATIQVVGDLNQPDRGLLMVLPVSQVYGLRNNASSKMTRNKK